MTQEPPRLREVSKLEFVVEHVIRSTPERIFEAYTTPDLVAQWWSGGGLRVDEMDVRPGGRWRFVRVGGDGPGTVMHGEYREVEPARRLSYTFNHGEGNANEVLGILDLERVEDGTRVTLTTRCASREQRDALMSFGAEAGARAALKGLAALLRSVGA